MGSAYTHINGNLGSDAQFKYAGKDGQTLMVSFSVATDTWTPDGAETTWYNVVMFGKRVEGLGKLYDNGGLRKGSFVSVRGTTRLNKFTKNDGSFDANLSLVADNIDVAMPPRNQDQGYQQQAPQQNYAPAPPAPQQQMNQAQAGWAPPPAPQYAGYGQS